MADSGKASNVAERSMTVGGLRMAWLEAGAGWPVILLHGFPLNAAMWRPQLECVPQGWRFIAPDLRGFGRTELRATDEAGRDGSALTMADYAADVLALMDGMEVDQAVIGGLSMGGYVTFAIHRKDPARFTGMILADTKAPADTPLAREGRNKMREVLASGGPGAIVDQMLPKLLAEATRRDRPALVPQVRALIESAAPAAIDAAIAALMTRPDSTPDLRGISCATLVIAGEHDEITPPAESEAMQRAIPRSALSLVPGAGHLASLEQPETFSRALEDFLVSHL